MLVTVISKRLVTMSVTWWTKVLRQVPSTTRQRCDSRQVRRRSQTPPESGWLHSRSMVSCNKWPRPRRDSTRFQLIRNRQPGSALLLISKLHLAATVNSILGGTCARLRILSTSSRNQNSDMNSLGFKFEAVNTRNNLYTIDRARSIATTQMLRFYCPYLSTTHRRSGLHQQLVHCMSQEVAQGWTFSDLPNYSSGHGLEWVFCLSRDCESPSDAVTMCTYNPYFGYCWTRYRSFLVVFMRKHKKTIIEKA